MSTAISRVYSNVSYALGTHTNAITLLQEQASSGNTVNRASDSPANAYRILGLNSDGRTLDSYKQNILNLKDTLDTSTTVIQNMSTQLSDVETLLTQIVGGMYDANGRERIAEKVNSSLEQLVAMVNTQQGGQYLFGGSDTSTAPYVVEREGGKITRVTYQGSQESRRVDVASGLDVDASLVGDDIFRMHDRQDPIFLGTTGARAGTGTSNVTGDVWLTVEWNGTNYRLSADNGATFVDAPVAGDDNLAVTDSRTGRVLYVDTTGITGTGVEMVQVPGTYDILGILINLRDTLNNDMGLSSDELINYVSECADGVQAAYNTLVQANVSVGSQVGFLTTLSETLDSMKSNTENQTTELQQADVAEIAIELSRRETLYQMSLSVANAILKTSLWDYIT
jgi:flagellar hook-associated protein 3 FlgL